MRENFETGFKLTIGLEGKLSTDPRDPGNYYPNGTPGFTVWGLCTRWNPSIRKDWTTEQFKSYYYEHYWKPAGCDDLPFPMDICQFDSQVNPQNDPKLPGGGNQEILNLKPTNWQEYMIFRMQRYQRVSQAIYVKGHIFRVLNLCKQITDLIKAA